MKLAILSLWFLVLNFPVSLSAEEAKPPAGKEKAPAKKPAAKKPGAAKPGPKKSNRNNPAPTQADFRYGPHPRQVLDFWKAGDGDATPVLFFIHGGGWVNGDKSGITVQPWLDAGISVVSINYRYTTQAGKIQPPVKAPLSDAARALQTVRSKAAEWKIDKTKICASGGSAGACSSLWLGFHPDMADPASDDPIARESTRLFCAAVLRAQTTLDPQQMKDWTPNSRYGGHAFGFNGDKAAGLSGFEEFLAARKSIEPLLAEYSPYALLTPDDCPVYLFYDTPPALGKQEKDPTHTANFGLKLQERARELGVPCELQYPGAPDAPHATTMDYFIARLKSGK